MLGLHVSVNIRRVYPPHYHSAPNSHRPNSPLFTSLGIFFTLGLWVVLCDAFLEFYRRLKNISIVWDFHHNNLETLCMFWALTTLENIWYNLEIYNTLWSNENYPYASRALTVYTLSFVTVQLYTSAYTV